MKLRELCNGQKLVRFRFADSELNVGHRWFLTTTRGILLAMLTLSESVPVVCEHGSLFEAPMDAEVIVVQEQSRKGSVMRLSKIFKLDFQLDDNLSTHSNLRFRFPEGCYQLLQGITFKLDRVQIPTVVSNKPEPTMMYCVVSIHTGERFVLHDQDVELL